MLPKLIHTESICETTIESGISCSSFFNTTAFGICICSGIVFKIYLNLPKLTKLKTAKGVCKFIEIFSQVKFNEFHGLMCKTLRIIVQYIYKTNGKIGCKMNVITASPYMLNLPTCNVIIKK